MEELFRHRILSVAEAEWLVRRMKEGDPDARSILIRHHMRLLANIAHRFENTGIPFEDLFSIGMIGLIKGVDSFNPNKGSKLATYAGRCVENEILMYLRKSRRRVSEVSMNEVINVDFEGKEMTLLEILTNDENILDDIVADHERESLLRLVDSLSQRDKKVIELCFGLNGKDTHLQREIAKMMGFEQSYVSRIVRKALLKLRKKIED